MTEQSKEMTYEVKVSRDGEKRWLLNGVLHREDGPAIEFIDGSKCWYRDGKPHRDCGLPACEWAYSGREWWVNGKLHRIDGPAIEDVEEDTFEFYIDGERYEQAEFNERVMRLFCQGKLVDIGGKKYKLCEV